MNYKYELPPLPYAFDAFEPYIDAMTMEIHYTKHHQAYINNLNAALVNHPELQTKPLKQLLANIDALPTDVRTAIRNNGGGTINHDMFWKVMKPGSKKPKGAVAENINKFFGSFEAFKEQFNGTARSVFGSGWAWLSVDTDGRFIVSPTANQDTPISHGMVPLMGLDVWEHAYYLLYQNRRPDYINAWWYVVNWEQVEENYRALIE